MDVSSTGEILSASTRGIGFGSELSINASVLLKNEKNIMTFVKFSPNGKQIAFVTLPDGQIPFPLGGLWIVDSDGSNLRLMADADAGRGFEAVWHPNGESIAFVYRENPSDAAADQSFNNLISNIYLANVATGALTQLTHFSNTLVDAPHFSPDGQFLVFNVWSDKIQLWRADLKNNTLSPLQENTCCGFWLSNE
jgi:Tol biopolymer transport system component